jgi:hypothetical protein
MIYKVINYERKNNRLSIVTIVISDGSYIFLYRIVFKFVLLIGKLDYMFI